MLQDLRQESATGHIRSNDAPNRRAQDMPTYRLLCGGCEQLIGKWEKTFAEKVYYPRKNDPTQVCEYDGWMSRFAASLVWRVIRVYELVGIPPPDEPAFLEAEKTWREFLLGKRENVGAHELHLLPLHGVDGIPAPGAVRGLQPFPANINRWMLRSAAIDLPIGRDAAWVFVKLPGYAFLGAARCGKKQQLVGTRLPMRKGRIAARGYEFPVELFNYMFGKAKEGAQLLASLSPTQKAKVQAAMKADPDRVARSQSAKAMVLDLNLFGMDAYEKPESDLETSQHADHQAPTGDPSKNRPE